MKDSYLIVPMIWITFAVGLALVVHAVIVPRPDSIVMDCTSRGGLVTWSNDDKCTDSRTGEVSFCEKLLCVRSASLGGRIDISAPRKSQTQ